MKRTPPGFTLLEVLVSTAILAMVSTLVYASMSVTLSSQKEVMRTQERFHAGRVALARMSRDFSCAFLSKHVDMMERNRETVFLGSGNKVTFTYVGHYKWGESERPESDQGVISYYLKTLSGEKVLIRREKTVIDDRPEKEGEESVLAEGVKRLEISYWDPVAEDWTEDWKAELEDTEPIIQDKTLQKVIKTAEMIQGQPTEEEEFILPPRVKIGLVLEDEDGNEYPFWTETEIPMRHAFTW